MLFLSPPYIQLRAGPNRIPSQLPVRSWYQILFRSMPNFTASSKAVSLRQTCHTGRACQERRGARSALRRLRGVTLAARSIPWVLPGRSAAKSGKKPRMPNRPEPPQKSASGNLTLRGLHHIRRKCVKGSCMGLFSFGLGHCHENWIIPLH